MLERLARACYRHRRLVSCGWLALLVGLLALSSSLGTAFHSSMRLPATESRRAFEILGAHFPEQAGNEGSVVFEAPAGAAQGIDDPAVRTAMVTFLGTVAAVDGVTVVSPYDQEGARQVSPDRHVAFATLHFADLSEGRSKATAAAITTLRSHAEVPAGTAIELGGDPFVQFAPPTSEWVGLLAAVVILLIAFGSVLAMGLPISVALFGIGSGIALVTLVSHLITMPDFTTELAMMIGLGVGIDYALFIVTRYREALAAGGDPEQAVATAITTAGRAVLFAGTTVVISLLGMFLMGVSFVRGLAVGGSLGVITTMAASVTLLPALLGFVGRNVDRFGLPHRRHRSSDPERTVWYRWSRLIQRHPWPFAIGGFSVLAVLALPVFGLRLGTADDGNLATTQTARRAYDLLAKGFGPGFNGPLVLATELDPGQRTDQGALEQVTTAVSATPGVLYVSPAQVSPDGRAAVWQLFPATAPQDEATTTLIHHLREDVLPTTGLQVKVGGVTAVFADFADYLGSRLPLFMGAVLAMSFLLLAAVFRSLLVPLKAVLLNLLSIGGAYGVIVAVFQWGWLRNVSGVGREGPIEAWAPMMLFAIVFGLSMDYEVFLLSRMREEYDRTGDNTTAVADGLATTARVITAAASIMVCVFAGFVLTDQRQIKLFGLGLSVAVLIDATIVRMVLVPATMELLGDRNWWLPRWLDRLLPRLSVEGSVESPREGSVESSPPATVALTASADPADAGGLTVPAPLQAPAAYSTLREALGARVADDDVAPIEDAPPIH